MRESLTAFNRQDFAQRYRGAFGWLEHENKKTLVHITDVTNTQVHFDTSKAEGFFAFAQKDVVFEFLPVTRGFVPTTDKVYHLIRIPARQWQRGISEQNTSIQSLGARGFSYEAINLKTLTTIFEAPLSFEDSASKFFGNKSPVGVLSRHFALTKTAFYFMNREAGTYDFEKKIITPVPIVKQELQDLVNRSPWLAGITLAQ